MLLFGVVSKLAAERELDNYDSTNDYSQGDFGWGFGFTCLCLDVIFGVIFWIGLQEADKKLPPNRRVMNGCVNVLYWIVCCFTSWLGTLCFYVVAKYEINQRLMQINSAVFNQVPVGGTSQYKPQQQQHFPSTSYSASNNYNPYSTPNPSYQPSEIPVVEAIPVYQVSKS